MNNSVNNTKVETSSLYPENVVIVVTIIYCLIFVTGIFGNVCTCLVIGRNKSMHTSTNFYLFSLALSDMLLLFTGLLPEMYRLWCPEKYLFPHAVCILESFSCETATNATVLTVTAFTIERYIAICHPFVAHKMSTLSRAIRHIVFIWLVAMTLAIPQTIQYGVVSETREGIEYRTCTMVGKLFEHSFEISMFVFFVGPMTLITVLYVLIGLKLRQTTKGKIDRMREVDGKAQKRVVKMLGKKDRHDRMSKKTVEVGT